MSLADDLRYACHAVIPQEPLSRHTSLSIGGPADYYAEVATVEELIGLRRSVTLHKLPVFFLGAGSNLLVSDRGIRGLVIHLQGDFRRIEFKGNLVKVGAAAMMARPTILLGATARSSSAIKHFDWTVVSAPSSSLW